jgi:hypothetical protein
MRSARDVARECTFEAGHSRGDDVASRGSWPAITDSSSAASAAVRASGPIWSSDEPNAMRP